MLSVMCKNIYGTLLLVIVTLSCINASSIPAGTAITRRPVLAPTPIVIVTTTSQTNTRKPTPTVEDSTHVLDEEEEEPQTTTIKPSKPTAQSDVNDSPAPTSDLNTTNTMDPTDYATVLPTRWQRRRRFGAQSEAQAQFKVDWILVSLLFCGGFIGILLF